MALRTEDFADDEIDDYGPAEILWTQGEVADHMALVVEGEIELSVGGAVVGRAGPGEVVGETGILENEPRDAMAVSVGDSRLVNMDRRRFEAFVAKDPAFGREVLRSLARRLRERNIAAGGTGGTGAPRRSDTTSAMMAAVKGATRFAGGATIFEEGDRGATMFIVQSGTVELRVGGKPVGEVEAGGFFGEMALLENAPRSASAHAAPDCRLLALDREKFDFLVQRTPAWVVEMMREMAGRLHRMGRAPA